MNDCCYHRKDNYSIKNECYLFTCYIRNTSMLNFFNYSENFKTRGGCLYTATVSGSKDKFALQIESQVKSLKCSVSIFISSGTLLYSNSLNKPTKDAVHPSRINYYDLISSDNECFEKLKQHPNDNLLFICRIIYSAISWRTGLMSITYSTDSSHCLKTLAEILRNSSESLLNEKVLLRVGEETRIVSKAVLCARSSVFAKMFQSDMKEIRDNSVIITDIKMPVVKVLVSFLYNGKLPNYEFDFLCDIYYAANKYDITELRLVCVDYLISKISMENVIKALKFAFLHNDERLKSTLMTYIATNIETFISKNDWEDLINDEPKIASEVLNFYGF